MKYDEIGETCNTHGREESMSIISVLNPEGINFLRYLVANRKII